MLKKFQVFIELLKWFDENKREMPWRTKRTPYRVWVSEVMLQQTQVDTVIPYFEKFVEKYPDISSFAGADFDDVLKMWEGLGYYNRIRNFHKAANQVMNDFNGVIPPSKEMFLSLPGVGPYICAAVLSIAYGHPLPVLDGNVSRVMARFLGCDLEVQSNEFKKHINTILSEIIHADNPGRFNESLMELGASVCKKSNPNCLECPLKKECLAYKNSQTAILPVVKKKPKAPHYKVAVAIIMDDGEMFIQKREMKGHLGGLWEFPGGKVNEGESFRDAVVRECQEELNTEIVISQELPPVNHVYTHFKITIVPFLAECDRKQVKTVLPHCWIPFADRDKYAFPKANHKIFSYLKDKLK